MRASIKQFKDELRFDLPVNEQPVWRDMALALADMSPDKFMVAATCGQRLPHRQQSNDLVQLRHVQASLDGEFVAHYASLAEAHRQTGFGQGNICHHLHGKPNYTHAYGYIWKYSAE
jgi:hypothetical protein